MVKPPSVDIHYNLHHQMWPTDRPAAWADFRPPDSAGRRSPGTAAVAADHPDASHAHFGSLCWSNSCR